MNDREKEGKGGGGIEKAERVGKDRERGGENT